MKKKVSLKDIAKEVGVSTALVSYVLNNLKQGRINKDIAQKIRDVARSLNYRPNQIAKSLKTNKTNTIGLIVADISNPFSSTLARIIEDEANSCDYTVIFASSDENPDKFSKLLDTLLNRQVDGLIISPPANSEQQIEHLIGQEIPFVLLDRRFPSLNTNCVLLDNFSASFKAAQHLVESGCMSPGMISYNSNLVHLRNREEGFIKGLKKAGISVKKKMIKRVEIMKEKDQVGKVLRDLLDKEGADGLLLASNIIALNTLRHINTLSVKVPRDLAIVCFDETESLDLFYSPITCIRQPLADMGKTALRILLESINRKNSIIQISMDADLIIRKSTMR